VRVRGAAGSKLEEPRVTLSGTNWSLRPNFTPRSLALAIPSIWRFAANVILKLGDERQDAHNQLAGPRRGVDGRIISDLEGYALFCEFRDDPVEV
jgi:hypothetical protein